MFFFSSLNEESAFFSKKSNFLFSLVHALKKKRSRVSPPLVYFDAQNISSRFARIRTQQTRGIISKERQQFARYD